MIFFSISISIITSFIIIFNKNKIAKILGIFDKPDSFRKLHLKPIPALGGTILFTSLIIFFITSILYEKNNFFTYSNLIFFSVISFLIGLLDDKQKLVINHRIILIILNCFFLLLIDPSLKITKIYINNPNSVILIDNFFVSLIVTVFCIFLLYNSINFLDGINGNLILLTIFWIFIFSSKSNLYSELSLLILSSLLICFFYNLKNKIFMGNSGSLLISSLLAFLFLSSHGNEYKKIFSDEIVILFLIPGLDMIRLFFLRLANNKSPFKGDQNHLHHLLIKKLNKKYVFICYFIITVIPYVFYALVDLNIFLILALIFIYYLILIKFLSGFIYHKKI